MVLTNVIVLVVLKILDNLASLQFELSEQPNSFVKLRLVLEIESIATFIKTRLYWKQGYIKMFKHVETFNSNKGCKWEIFVFIPTLPFSKQKFTVYLSNVLCANSRPWKTLYLHENESLQHSLSSDMRWKDFRPSF